MPNSLPRLPILSWSAFSGLARPGIACVLDLPHVKLTTSGRAAIALALRELEIGVGSRVLVPTYHCPTMIGPIVAAGAEPLFFPIDRSGAAQLDVISDMDLSGVHAMLAAHYFGLPQPMAALRAFCDERGIALIEDCAHAFFGVSDGQAVGSWGDYGIASLTKFLPVVEGGCLLSAQNPLDHIHLASRSLKDEAKNAVDILEESAGFQQPTGLGRLLNALFALKRQLRGANAARVRAQGTSADIANEALQQLAPGARAWSEPTRLTSLLTRHVHLQNIVSRRRQNYAWLAGALADAPGVRPLVLNLPADAAPYVFPLWVADPEPRYQALRAAGIPVFRWDWRWPGTPELKNDIGTEWAAHVFQIGCHQNIDLHGLVKIADAVRHA